MKLAIAGLRARLRPLAPAVVVLTFVLADAAAVANAATTTGMPWDGPLNQIVSALTGSIAHLIGVVAIFALGAGMAFSEGGTVMRKALWVALGLILAFNASSWGLQFLGLGGGLVV